MPKDVQMGLSQPERCFFDTAWISNSQLVVGNSTVTCRIEEGETTFNSVDLSFYTSIAEYFEI